MGTNTQLSDKEKALAWWRPILWGKKINICSIYFPDRYPAGLTGREIEEIWRKETQQSTPEGEERFTKGEWYVSKDVRVDKNMCPVPFYEICNTSDITWIAQVSAGNLKENGEAEANAYLIAASKDLYYALSNLIDFFDNYPPHFSDGKSMDIDLDGFKEQLAALKKANPKLP